jgi:Zn-dependent protease
MSVMLFTFVFGLQLSLRTVVMFLAVLFIHELGHAFAMRCFGYRDLQILFVPMLGAVAYGRKPDATPLQEVIVLLAGPIPGIVAGTLVVGLGWGAETQWVVEGAQLMLLVNYFNLLPLVPLDGGRMMSLVLFDRRPRLQFAFNALSALIAIGLGLAIGESILCCIGVVLLLFAPRQMAQVQTFTKVQDALEGSGKTSPSNPGGAVDPIRSIYAELQAAKFDRWNTETKYQFVRRVLEHLDRRTPSMRVAVASLAVYCVAFALPIGIISYKKLDPAATTPAAITSEAESADGSRYQTPAGSPPPAQGSADGASQAAASL